jgi:hypothetical protein
MIYIIHVDDIIVTGPSNEDIKKIEQKLQKTLKLKYLGYLSEFLGIEFIRKEKSISINQKKYINKIRYKYNKQDLIPVGSPIEIGI